jgi:5-methylcytosine-specific restriction protein A
MTRTVPEWIGKSDDHKAPQSVRARVFERHGGRCHITGARIGAGDRWELDHVLPLIKGGENRESNLAPALYKPHREKAADETRDARKAERIRLKHTGGWPRTKRPLQSRGFDRSRPEFDR